MFPGMFGLFLLICVLAVGGMLFVVMVRAGVRQWLRQRAARQQAERYAVIVVEARRAHAERMAQLEERRATVSATVSATVNALPRGELTGVINLLEQSAAFKPIAAPVPAAPRRTPRGSTSPPLGAAPRSSDRLGSSVPSSAPVTASAIARPVHATPASAAPTTTPTAPARVASPPPLPPAARMRAGATQPPPLPPLPSLRTAVGTRPPPPRRARVEPRRDS